MNSVRQCIGTIAIIFSVVCVIAVWNSVCNSDDGSSSFNSTGGLNTTAASAEDSGFVRFLKHSGRHLIAPVTIGKIKGGMIVDTGSPVTILNGTYSRQMRDLRISGIEMKINFWIARSSLHGLGVYIPQMCFGRLRLDNIHAFTVKAVAFDKLPKRVSGLPVLGIIGVDILSQYYMGLDFYGMRLTTLRSDTGCLPSVPIKVLPNGCASVQIQIYSDKNVNMLIDTGSWFHWLPPHFRSSEVTEWTVSDIIRQYGVCEHHLDMYSNQQLSGIIEQDFRVVYCSSAVIAQSIVIAPFFARRAAQPKPPSWVISPDVGILGASILRRWRLHFDFKKQVVFFEALSAPPTDLTFGIAFDVNDSGTLWITHAHPLLYRQGELQAGDTILSVDGERLIDQNLHRLRQILTEPLQEKPVIIEVLRNQSKVQVILKPVSASELPIIVTFVRE